MEVLALIPCKDMTLDPKSTSKVSSWGEHCSSPYKDVTRLFPNQCGTLTLSNTPTRSDRQLEHGQHNMGIQIGMNLALIRCKDMILGSNSIPKASSWKENCLSSHKQTPIHVPTNVDSNLYYNNEFIRSPGSKGLDGRKDASESDEKVSQTLGAWDFNPLQKWLFYD